MKRTLNLIKSDNKFVEYDNSFVEYKSTYLYDYNIQYKMEVVSRTEKTAKVAVRFLTKEYHPYIEFKNKKINTDENGIEYIVFDDGIVFRADRVAA